MSHVAAASQNGSPSSDDDIGGRRPRGGIDYRDDRDPDFDLKSSEHFLRRLARAHSELALQAILVDARKAVRAWTHTPVSMAPSVEQQFVRGSFRWKCAIADDPDPSIGNIKHRYQVSERAVYRYREQYKGLARRAA